VAPPAQRSAAPEVDAMSHRMLEIVAVPIDGHLRPGSGTAGPWEAWEVARADALLAYRAWGGAVDCDKGDAYAAYVAAADREAAAAGACAERLESRRGRAIRAS
jgi:hypothetical protein